MTGSIVFFLVILVAPQSAPEASPASTKRSGAPVSTGSAPRPTAAPTTTSSDSGDPETTAPPSSTTPSPGANPPASDENDVTRYQFTGLDIEGELRTPALLQFLTRIAGEFETMGIPHRSFMPELRRTVSEDAL